MSDGLRDRKVALIVDVDSAALSVTERSFTVLTVGASMEDHLFLRQLFRQTNWKLQETHTYREAVTALCKDRMPVVVCECGLPDGSWKDVLSQIAPLPDPPRLIVTSPRADDQFWAEVLNMGHCDVLEKPLDKKEVVWAIGSAWLQWQDECNRKNQMWIAPKAMAAAGK
jgi:DNA-binding response OmpR family regulator